MTNWQPSPADAAEELLARRGARRRLMDFTQFTYPRYVADDVHHLIAAALDEVVKGTIKRLMIFAPPQVGKSELVSVRLPAFWLGQRPDDPVLLASYGADLAHSKSHQTRGIVESDDFQALFGNLNPHYARPVSTRSDSRAVHRWQLEPPYRGGMLAVGVGGPITGHGGLLGIIDDPFENWAQAQSATIRAKVWDWWRGTFRTRIWEGGAIVLIMTRWHADDLAGRILEEQGDEWTVLRLAALAETQAERDSNNLFLGLHAGEADPLGREPGEPLSPQRYSRAAMGTIKRDVGTIVWMAEYQGTPRAPEGNRFKRPWFQRVEASPVQARRARYWDKAGTEGGTGAYTAGVLLAITEPGLIYVEDVVRGRWSAYQREQVIKETAQMDADRYGPVKIYVEQEPGSGGKESAEATIRNLAGYSVYADRPSGDKDVRLEPLAAQLEAGNVFLVRGSWNADYIEEFITIPNGAYRDQSDASAGAFNKLQEKRAPTYRKAKARLASWDRR